MKIGIIGFGGAGQAHYRRFVTLPGVSVAKVYEPKSEKRAAWQQQFSDVSFASSRDELLDAVDLVSICTPDHAHVEDALAAIRTGRHTLVEKPMVTTHEDATRIAEALCAAPNVIFGVHHQMRYVPAFAAARELLQRGELGTLLALEADYLHDMRERATRFDDWRVQPDSVQQIALGGLSHTLDLLRWVAADDVEEIHAVGGHRGWPEYPDIDTMAATMRFRCGAIGRTFKTIASSGPQRNTLAVYGTRGQVRDNVHWPERGGPRLTCVPRSLVRLRREHYALPLVNLALRMTMFHNYPLNAYEHHKACLRLLGEFIACVRDGRPFSVGVEEGRRTVELCLACIASQRSGWPVRLAPV
jgi:predicted dehydrogenase